MIGHYHQPRSLFFAVVSAIVFLMPGYAAGHANIAVRAATMADTSTGHFLVHEDMRARGVVSDVRVIRLASVRPFEVMGGGTIPSPLPAFEYGGMLRNPAAAGSAAKEFDCSRSLIKACNALGDPPAFAKPALAPPCYASMRSDCENISEQREVASIDPAALASEIRRSSTGEDGIIDNIVRTQNAKLMPRSSFSLRTIGRKIPKGQIVIFTSERRLLYFFQDSLALEFPIGVARRGLQRTGNTQITLKRRDPTWIPTGLQHRVYRNLPASVKPGDSKNPLGSRALNLTIPNIRIHGTNDDASIGAALSDGCFKMYNSDIEYLFDVVAVGAKVTIVK